jgi:carbon storage regulator
MGLILRRKIGESILIGPDIEVTVQEVRAGSATLNIVAPEEYWIVRSEVIEEPQDDGGRSD